jgi:hypothetical protein
MRSALGECVCVFCFLTRGAHMCTNINNALASVCAKGSNRDERLLSINSTHACTNIYICICIKCRRKRSPDVTCGQTKNRNKKQTRGSPNYELNPAHLRVRMEIWCRARRSFPSTPNHNRLKICRRSKAARVFCPAQKHALTRVVFDFERK